MQARTAFAWRPSEPKETLTDLTHVNCRQSKHCKLIQPTPRMLLEYATNPICHSWALGLGRVHDGFLVQLMLGGCLHYTYC